MNRSRLQTVVCTSVFALFVFATYDGMAKPPDDPPEDMNENAILSLLTPKTIFVTSARYSGDLVYEAMMLGGIVEDGLAAADYICTYHAENAGLKGNYVAIISTTTVNANDRLTTSLGPYRVVTGTPVAASFSSLFSTYAGYTGSPESPPIRLISPIRYDENGDRISTTGSTTPKRVWTGTNPLGEIQRLTPSGALHPSITTCFDWTSDADATNEECPSLNDENCGVAGLSISASTQWINYETASCSDQNRLYCAER